MMLSSVVHALEQGDVLERAGDAAPRRLPWLHPGAALALEGDRALGRVIEAVDAVQHRGLAGAVRTDDGADLALEDVERDIAQRLHAAEGERHVLDREDRVALDDEGDRRGALMVGPRRPPLPLAGRGWGWGACRAEGDRCRRWPYPPPRSSASLRLGPPRKGEGSASRRSCSGAITRRAPATPPSRPDTPPCRGSRRSRRARPCGRPRR